MNLSEKKGEKMGLDKRKNHFDSYIDKVCKCVIDWLLCDVLAIFEIFCYSKNLNPCSRSYAGKRKGV